MCGNTYEFTLTFPLWGTFKTVILLLVLKTNGCSVSRWPIVNHLLYIRHRIGVGYRIFDRRRRQIVPVEGEEARILPVDNDPSIAA